MYIVGWLSNQLIIWLFLRFIVAMVKIYTAEKAAAVFKRSSNSNNDSNNPDSLNG